MTAMPIEPTDPFADLAELRVVNASDLAVEKLLVSVPVRKPGRQEFFRVHPGEDFTLDTATVDVTDGMDVRTYIVMPGMRQYLVGELRAVRIFTCITRAGTVLLWAAKLPGIDANDGSRRWAVSALRAAEEAKTHWVRIIGNKGAGAYDVFRAQGNLHDPVWPDYSFRDLLRIAFEERVVDSPDHEVIRRLNGEL